MDKLKLLVETLTILGGALASVYQWWNARFRTQLKTDLEILQALESLGREQVNYRIVKAHIDETIEKAYACGTRRSRESVNKAHINFIDLGFGAIFLLGFVVWISEILEFGNTWWRVLLAAGFAFSCIFAIFNVVHKRGVSKKVVSEQKLPANGVAADGA